MIKHPLIQKEWKTTRWMMLLFSLVFVIVSASLNNNIGMFKRRYLLNHGTDVTFMSEVYRMSVLMVPVMLMGIIMLVIVLFAHDRNLSVGKFISSLPFSRKEQFTIKYIMGFITFTLPFLLFAVATFIMRIQNEKWISYLYKYSPYGGTQTKQDGVGALLLWLGIVWIIMLTVYSFLMLMQTLMGQNIIAGAVGAIIYLVPWFLAFAVPANAFLILDRYWKKSINMMDSIVFFFYGNPMSTYEQTGTQFLGERWVHYQTYEYRHLGINIALLMTVTLMSILLAYHFTQTNDVEKNGDIVMYPWVGKILIVGVSICSMLLLPIIVVVFTQIENSILSLVLMAIGGTLGYVISSKSIEITKKHG